MQCGGCGAAHAEGVRFCDGCGATLGVVAPRPAIESAAPPRSTDAPPPAIVRSAETTPASRPSARRRADHPPAVAPRIEPASPALAAAEKALAAGLLDEAEDAADDVIAEQPDSPAGWRVRGESRRARGDFEEAASALEAALSRGPSDVRTLVSLAIVRGCEGKRDVAADLLRRALAADPTNDDARALLHLQTDRADPVATAVRELESTAGRTDEDPHDRDRLAAAYLVACTSGLVPAPDEPDKCLTTTYDEVLRVRAASALAASLRPRDPDVLAEMATRVRAIRANEGREYIGTWFHAILLLFFYMVPGAVWIWVNRPPGFVSNRQIVRALREGRDARAVARMSGALESVHRWAEGLGGREWGWLVALFLTCGAACAVFPYFAYVAYRQNRADPERESPAWGERERARRHARRERVLSVFRGLGRGAASVADRARGAAEASSGVSPTARRRLLVGAAVVAAAVATGFGWRHVTSSSIETAAARIAAARRAPTSSAVAAFDEAESSLPSGLLAFPGRGAEIDAMRGEIADLRRRARIADARSRIAAASSAVESIRAAAQTLAAPDGAPIADDVIAALTDRVTSQGRWRAAIGSIGPDGTVIGTVLAEDAAAIVGAIREAPESVQPRLMGAVSAVASEARATALRGLANSASLAEIAASVERSVAARDSIPAEVSAAVARRFAADVVALRRALERAASEDELARAISSASIPACPGTDDPQRDLADAVRAAERRLDAIRRDADRAAAEAIRALGARDADAADAALAPLRRARPSDAELRRLEAELADLRLDDARRRVLGDAERLLESGEVDRAVDAFAEAMRRPEIADAARLGLVRALGAQVRRAAAAVARGDRAAAVRDLSLSLARAAKERVDLPERATVALDLLELKLTDADLRGCDDLAAIVAPDGSARARVALCRLEVLKTGGQDPNAGRSFAEQVPWGERRGTARGFEDAAGRAHDGGDWRACLVSARVAHLLDDTRALPRYYIGVALVRTGGRRADPSPAIRALREYISARSAGRDDEPDRRADAESVLVELGAGTPVDPLRAFLSMERQTPERRRAFMDAEVRRLVGISAAARAEANAQGKAAVNALGRDDFAAAVAASERALRADPANFTAAVNYAVALARLRDASAREAIMRVFRLFPGCAEAMVEAAGLYAKEGDLDAAAKWLAGALDAGGYDSDDVAELFAHCAADRRIAPLLARVVPDTVSSVLQRISPPDPAGTTFPVTLLAVDTARADAWARCEAALRAMGGTVGQSSPRRGWLITDEIVRTPLLGRRQRIWVHLAVRSDGPTRTEIAFVTTCYLVGLTGSATPSAEVAGEIAAELRRRVEGR